MMRLEVPSSTSLEVTFERLNERQSASTAVRSDGVTVRVPGYGPSDPLPHDLAHFGIERALRMSRGFWGSVAAGAVFHGMTVLSGRRRPHASERSDAIIRANGDTINQAEMLVGALLTVMEDGLDRDPDAALSVLRRWQSTSREPIAVDRDTLDRMLSEVRALIQAWRAVETGQSMSLRWDVPTDAPRAAARDRRRAAIRRR